MTEPARRVVRCVVDDDRLMELIPSTLSVSLPSVAIERVTMASGSRTPRADCVILASAGSARPTLDMLRALRSSGAEDSVVILSLADDDELRAGMELLSGTRLVSGSR